MAPALPDDIIIKKILIRVPVKSMVRFRCVCKLWNSLFSNPEFTLSQSNRSVSQNSDDDHIILNKSSRDSCISIISRATLSETLIDSVPYPVSARADMHLVGSINGIVCLVCLSRQGGYYFILWNPAIQQSKKILLPTKRWPFKLEKPKCSYLLGFGWDHMANDFKLIFKPMRSPLAVVYSCKTDSWSDNVVLWMRGHDGIVRWSPSVIVKGNPYWTELGGIIIKFDAKISKFTSLAVPCKDGYYSLIDLNDCLGRIEYVGSRPYVLKLVGLYCFHEFSGSWFKMHTINLDDPISCNPITFPICFKHGGGIIFNKKDFLYDPWLRKIKRLGNHSLYYNGFSYTPSFLFLEGMESFDERGPRRSLHS